MKKLFLLPLLIFLFVTGAAQELEANAKYIKDNYATDYTNTIRKYAVKEWGDDFQMIVYAINQQADALVNLVDEFESDNTNIAFKAIQEWSYEGYKSQNIAKFKELKVFGVEQLLKLHCDWTMVKYEYDNQVEAKNAF